jgi:DNA-binding transcriptional ArsR family regulator
LTWQNFYFSILVYTKIMKNSKELARMCRTLAVEARVAIIQLLKHRALCVGALSRFLGLTPGAVSQHLRVLRDAGLVESEKRGYFVHYRINHHVLDKWKIAMELFLEKGVVDSAYQPPEKGEGTCVMKNKVAKNRKS